MCQFFDYRWQGVLRARGREFGGVPHLVYPLEGHSKRARPRALLVYGYGIDSHKPQTWPHDVGSGSLSLVRESTSHQAGSGRVRPCAYSEDDAPEFHCFVPT